VAAAWASRADLERGREGRRRRVSYRFDLSSEREEENRERNSLDPLGKPSPKGLGVLSLKLLDELGSSFWRASDRREVDVRQPVGRFRSSSNESGSVEVGDFRHDLENSNRR